MPVDETVGGLLYHRRPALTAHARQRPLQITYSADHIFAMPRRAGRGQHLDHIGDADIGARLLRATGFVDGEEQVLRGDADVGGILQPARSQLVDRSR